MAFSYMWQTQERLATPATGAGDNQPQKHVSEQRDRLSLARWISLAEAELLWDYPNPDQLEGDSCRMGFPNWRRTLILPLIEMCATSDDADNVLEQRCVDRWFNPLQKATKDSGVLEAGLYDSLRQAVHMDRELALTVKDLFHDGAAKLWRRIAVLVELG